MLGPNEKVPEKAKDVVPKEESLENAKAKFLEIGLSKVEFVVLDNFGDVNVYDLKC